MSTQVRDPILSDGLLDVAYFNGRVLTAEDLRADQTVRRQVDARLGRAIGPGVVKGLDVSIALQDGDTDKPKDGRDGREAALTITHGLAITPSGRTLELAKDIELRLHEPVIPAVDSGFADCPNGESDEVWLGTGLYLLTIGHATGFLQRAPMVGISTDGQISGCGSRYEVQGVVFRQAGVGLGDLGFSGTAETELDALLDATNESSSNDNFQCDLSLLRNRVAHALFGTERHARVGADPFGLATVELRAPNPGDDALAALVERGCLTNEETPLALIYWTQKGIGFVDVWAVRRRPSVGLDGAPWLSFLSEQRMRVAEAVSFQFQDQLATLLFELLKLLKLKPDEVKEVKAMACFRYLPPAGLLPLASENRRVFDHDTFFKDPPTKPNPIDLSPIEPAMTDGNLLQSLFRDSLAHEPADLTSPLSRFRRYEIWGNSDAIAFASVTLPRIYGIGRHETARWDWNRFG